MDLPPITSPPPSPILPKLYLSHTLSAWNSRAFEFATVLFLTALFPGTLFYASLLALIRALSTTLLAARIGAYLDATDRLAAVRASIVTQRLSVALSCAALFGLHAATARHGPVFWLCFPAAVLAACTEKLAAIANTIAVERDWVVVIAESTDTPLGALNAVLRRIDLSCKLASPVVVSFVVELASTPVAILATLGMNLLSVAVEYFAIERVYHAVPALATKPRPNRTSPEISLDNRLTSPEPPLPTPSPWRTYLTHPLLPPSLSLSLLYLTVLTPGALFTTYLLSTGFSPLSTSVFRTVAALSELSATLALPFLSSRIGPLRAGFWAITYQTSTLALGLGAFLTHPAGGGAASLAAAIAASRLGLWGVDLAVQELVQTAVDESARGAFASAEAALQNGAECLAYAGTLVWSTPDEFWIPAMVSGVAVGAAAGGYAAYVRRARGHLVHVGCLEGCGGRKGGYVGIEEMEVELEEGEVGR
ncbi:hypothetical protein EJ06DRAFT_511875 [Trichodelitschia bisporula]|uniref:Solute carrier family 40 member n=1 Tax=Trichodelitschia bisporula TaxID=703511 RepID=A0A6G1HV30_9PEZI|nr:hypothetical protein EJ06DRAFT_511875 [Trichodelitschia bisporula]